MSRIVVLGGAGIIGQAICQDLAEDVSEHAAAAALQTRIMVS